MDTADGDTIVRLGSIVVGTGVGVADFGVGVGVRAFDKVGVMVSVETGAGGITLVILKKLVAKMRARIRKRMIEFLNQS